MENKQKYYLLINPSTDTEDEFDEVENLRRKIRGRKHPRIYFQFRKRTGTI